MKMRTRNVLKGRVVEIKSGLLMTEVKVDIGGDNIVTVMVTDAALKTLHAEVGDELEVLKDSDVMAARNLH
jgi:molybdopterin-binding protein